MERTFSLELRLLTLTRVKVTTTTTVGGIFIVMIQHYGQDLLTTTEEKSMGQEKEGGEYVHTGDSVGVVMDTTNGELSFAIGGVNLGVAYVGISLDEPLVPCVLLWQQGCSVDYIVL